MNEKERVYPIHIPTLISKHCQAKSLVMLETISDLPVRGSYDRRVTESWKRSRALTSPEPKQRMEFTNDEMGLHLNCPDHDGQYENNFYLSYPS